MKYEEYEALRASGLPLVQISDPINRGNQGKCVWERGVKKNVFSRNELVVIGKDIITYNDIVGYRRLCEFEFPLVFPDWLQVKFMNVDVEVEFICGGDGYRYKKYTEAGEGK